MGSFAQCSWPIWDIDDFTPCFQQDYLKILFPLIVIGLSVLHLSLQAIRSVAKNRKQGYQQVPEEHHHGHTDIPPEETEDEDDEALTMNGGGRLALVKTTTKGSIVQADSPPAQNLTIVVEELGIAGLIAIHIIALVTGTVPGQHGLLVTIVGLVTWVYVAILATLRLFLGNTKWRVPRIWNHTAAIYLFQWLFTVGIFRSVIIHPSSRLAQTLVIVEFVLTSLLFGLAITTRKGNKTVLLEWEGDIEPSREPLASLFSLATFSWVDPIISRGYKETLEMKNVWNLVPKEKAAAVLADYRAMKRTSTLAWHLLKYFKGELLLQFALAAFAGVFTFAPTLLLKAILEYVERPEGAPINVLWLYVILLPVLDIVRSFADNYALWIGRKICIRIRAIMVGEIYAKALRRKASAGKDKELGKKAPAAEKQSLIGKIKAKLGFKKDKADAEAAANGAAKDPAKDDEQANLGTIINLMSVDSFKIAEVTAYLHFICASAPSQLVVAIVLLWDVMGLSAIPGLVVMALLLPINYSFARGFANTSKKILGATDKRINVTNEVLQNIRIIKYFAWEAKFGRIVDEKRAAELKALRSRYVIWSFAVAVWNSVPVLITFFSFLMYTLIEHKPLYPSVAFTAISLFMLLRVPLDQMGDMFAHVQETKVSLDRVEEFLTEEETEKYEQLGEDNVDEDGNKVIGLRKANFIWGGKDVVADDGSMAFRLMDMDVDFLIGKLNIISGPTGSGKTSMLMALLGEMTLVEGKVYCPGGRSREDVRPDPETGLADTVAYVAQAAWLVNANIKDNILFAAPYDEKRYRDVIVACALERDLEILDNGDETLVGEKGITMSGGQKQRISLARAIYSNSQHIFLDDCLSAVDSHTAQWIFNNAIKGPLMAGRTCILVTHNLQLCAPSSHYVVCLENGRIAAQGPSAELIAAGKLGEDVQKAAINSASVSRIPSRVPSSVGEDGSETVVNPGDESASDARSKKNDKKKEQKDAMEEKKAVGSVKWPVIQLYLSSMGAWWFWAVALTVFGLQQMSGVATNFWVREWANQYVDEEVAHIDFSTASHSYSQQSLSPTYFASIANYGNRISSNFSASAVADVNVTYYLTVLAIIGLAGSVAAFIRDIWVFYGSLTASKKIHNDLITRVSRAKFKFFDVTPLGQLMNRFSKDLEAVDQEVAPIAIGVFGCALGILVTVVLITIITPGFLIAGVFITAAYYFVGAFYLRASRDLKRLESVQRSPLFQQFGETLSGMTTIRAYGDERRFIRENLSKINVQARPFIYLWAANRWLAFRTDVLGDTVSFFAGVFIIFSLGTGSVDAGSAGISLSYAIGFTENVLWLIRLYAINEQNMNSVERIKEYLDVEQEAEPIDEKNRPPKNWPSQGSVEFINYSTRYRADLDPVLRGLSFKINPKEKVGIVGRTGAGKSSLALAIFRALEADEGKILIDDIDVGLIGLRDLREAITIVPQDPTLFMGTIRSNLDPFDAYTDEQIFEALRKVQLIGPNESTSRPATRPTTPSAGSMLPATPNLGLIRGDSNSSPGSSIAPTNKNIFLNLSSTVSESGSNLSQGQRQLLCLARALLKRPNVLVMDEATASIDYATDTKIQETIRELTSTIITIAHRLQTIVDYDKVLVLDKGAVVEYGHPYELIRKENGSFRGMCDMSGELPSLLKAAKKKWDSGRLVDVDDEEQNTQSTLVEGEAQKVTEEAKKNDEEQDKKKVEAEVEARKRAEEDAKKAREAEEEAKKAEEESKKKKAEEDAKQKAADEETKKQAEEETKKQAEDKAKADEEAKKAGGG
ncbi:ABC transporter [Colletotrichum tamarilloi]|uniref:ABC transporter n=2 Tax=Colletotrichum acutatum species complex TaxID=2707335 RepID=A0ABQ9PA72_9PEZI|nr:ABC transporter [Colletotrichum tamarilloi]KAK0368022.1 ABC transporter [Colletotrichum limetticola]KAK1486679.1 ABC transporter [Colletotrichum tamarilloi]